MGTRGGKGSGAGGGDFKIDIPAEFKDYFKVEPESGKVAPGETVECKFTFSPPAEKSAASFNVLACELDFMRAVGSWLNCCCPIMLNGGAVAAGQPANAIVELRLRGYVRQI